MPGYKRNFRGGQQILLEKLHTAAKAQEMSREGARIGQAYGASFPGIGVPDGLMPLSILPLQAGRQLCRRAEPHAVDSRQSCLKISRIGGGYGA